MDLKIRQTKDYDIVVRQHWKIFPSDTINDLFNEKGSWHWIVLDNKDPVGFASMSEIDDKTLFFTRAGVQEKYRGHGIQKRLIRVRSNFAKKWGYKKIITYTLTSNPSSSNNLFEMGFRLYIPEYAWVGDHVNYFIKELT